jgi:hypothetical protein
VRRAERRVEKWSDISTYHDSRKERRGEERRVEKRREEVRRGEDKDKT